MSLEDGTRRARAASDERAVITGLGAVTPVGISIPDFWDSLLRGVSGVGPITHLDASAYPTRIAAEVKGFDAAAAIGYRAARRMSRSAQYAVVAAREAIEDAGLADGFAAPERVGVILGTSVGGLSEAERGLRAVIDGKAISPFFAPLLMPNQVSFQVSYDIGATGYNSTVVTACASGTQAVGQAARVIERGDADIVICGGSEAAICELALASFVRIRALSTRNDDPAAACRPFDADRDGFVMGEGAAILILESLTSARNRGARVYAEVVGHSSTADAHNVVAPKPGGEGAAMAIKLALHDAGLEPSDIDYVNAHGTSTLLGDPAETKAIKRAFGRRAFDVPISSTKSMIGHLMGAAGAVEAVACVLSMWHSMIPPTINLEAADPECDLDYVPNEARAARLDYSLSNSFGFGGQNACLVLRRFTEGQA